MTSKLRFFFNQKPEKGHVFKLKGQPVSWFVECPFPFLERSGKHGLRYIASVEEEEKESCFLVVGTHVWHDPETGKESMLLLIEVDLQGKKVGNELLMLDIQKSGWDSKATQFTYMTKLSFSFGISLDFPDGSTGSSSLQTVK